MARKKGECSILIEQPIRSAKKLMQIALNKGFKNRKQFIEHLCKIEVQKFDDKQLKLKL